MKPPKGSKDGGKAGIGERFQQETKYDPDEMGGHALDWRRQPEPYKNYEAPLAIISLPEPELTGDPHLWQLLHSRRSRREFDAGRTLTIEKLSAVLWATQGVTTRYGDVLFRTAPSAGGLYPIETYLLVRAVEGIEPGIYHFRPSTFDLEFLKRGDLARDVAEAALGQRMVMAAQVTFIWTAIVERSRWKYRERAYRYIYLDAGHIGENLYLAAGALGLGVCTIGAFFDDKANNIIGVDGIEETVIYLAAAGWSHG
jgi:SagB-type dehydrogenase family enzyme